MKFETFTETYITWVILRPVTFDNNYRIRPLTLPKTIELTIQISKLII